MYRFENLQGEIICNIKKLPSHIALPWLCQATIEDSCINTLITPMVKQYYSGYDAKKVMFIIDLTVCRLAIQFIHYSNPYRGKNINSAKAENILKILVSQTVQYIATGDPFFQTQRATHEPHIEHWLFDLRTENYSHSVTLKVVWQFERFYQMFFLIPSNSQNHEINNFNLIDKFNNTFSIQVDRVLKYFHALHAATIRQPGKFINLDNIKKDGSSNYNFLTREEIVLLCNHFSGSPEKIKLFNTSPIKNNSFKLYELSAIKAYQILAPFSDKQSTVIIPSPLLLANTFQAMIMFRLQNIDNFNETYGLIIEEYCEKLFEEIKNINHTKIYNEKQIEQLPGRKGKKKPDFVIQDNKGCIVIDCKKARITLGTIQDRDIDDLEKMTQNIRTGLIQTLTLSILLKNKMLSLSTNSNHNTNNIIRLIITSDTIHGINSEEAKKTINEFDNEIYDSTIPWAVLSIEQLERVIPAIKQGFSFYDYLYELTQGKDVDSKLDEFYEINNIDEKDINFLRATSQDIGNLYYS